MSAATTRKIARRSRRRVGCDDAKVCKAEQTPCRLRRRDNQTARQPPPSVAQEDLDFRAGCVDAVPSGERDQAARAGEPEQVG